MTKAEVYSRVASILCTLAETNGAPESTLYIFCDMDMHKWQSLRGILVGAGYVDIKGNYVRLTSIGLDTAAKLEAAIKKH